MKPRPRSSGLDEDERLTGGDPRYMARTSRPPAPDEDGPSTGHAPGLAGAAGRATFLPARAAARFWRGELDAALDAALRSPEVEQAIDRALAGPLPEAVARSIVRHRVVERVAEEIVRSGELDRMIDQALASQRALDVAQRVAVSPPAQRAVSAVLADPHVTEAIAQRTHGLLDEVVDVVRTASRRVDARLGRRPAGAGFAGAATRGLALVADLAVTAAIYTSAIGVAALLGALVGGLRPAWLVTAVLTAGWTVLAGSYFVLFWAAAGQTPGMRLMGTAVQRANGTGLGVGRSLVRFAGVLVSIIPAFAGFLPVLIDRRRRGLPDFLAGTVVIDMLPSETVPEAPGTGR